MIKTQNDRNRPSGVRQRFDHLPFVLWICFEFRISIFGFSKLSSHIILASPDPVRDTCRSGDEVVGGSGMPDESGEVEGHARE